MSEATIVRKWAAEFIGTAMLVMAVVGSGIMAERLAGGNVGVALLANTIATGAALVALILMFAPVSGAHFNPIVSLSALMRNDTERVTAVAYVVAQLLGGVLGVALANLMFDLPAISQSLKTRTGFGQWLGEFIATFGLVGVIVSASRRHSVQSVAFAVAAYITAAYWFTSSTSFANPAVTIARSLTDTFTGIRPTDVPAFIVAQILGGTAATYFFDWLVPRKVMNEKKRVLILCTGNSARSQMAEGLLRDIAGDRYAVESAGVAPSTVRPEAITVMHELGIDISSHRSKSVDEFSDEKFDYVITVCDNAREACPVFHGDVERIHWSFDDPASVEGTDDEKVSSFRKVRNEIRDRLMEFVER